jgi:hypothetical protein
MECCPVSVIRVSITGTGRWCGELEVRCHPEPRSGEESPDLSSRQATRDARRIPHVANAPQGKLSLALLARNDTIPATGR